MADTSLVFDLIARDKASEAFGSAGSAADGFGAKLGSIAKIGAASFAAVGVAAVGVGVGLFKLGGQFDDVSDNIRVKTGATGAALDGLNASFKRVAAGGPQSLEEAGDAVANLNQKLGLTGKPLEALSRQFLNLAHVTGGDVAGQMDSTIQLFRNFNVTAGDQATKLDELFRASQKSGVSFDQLSAQMTSSGVTLRQFGFTFEQSAAFVGSLAKAGVEASDVMPSLGKAAAVAAKQHKSAGVVLQEVFAKIKNSKDDTAAAGAAMEVFGAKAGPKMAALVRSGKLSIDELQASIVGGKDGINAAAADTADFAEKWGTFKNKILVGLEPLATGVFNAVGSAMEAVGPIADKIIGLFQGLGQDSSFANFGGTVTSTMEHIREVVSTILAAVQTFWAEHGAQIAETLSSYVEMFRSQFELVRAIVEKVVAVLTDLWDRFGHTLLDKLRIAFDAVVQIVRGAMTVLSGVFDLIKAVLTGKWGDAWDAILKIVSGAWDLIKGVLKLGLDALALAFEAAKAGISAAWSAIWHGIATVVTDVLINPAKNALNGLIGFVAGMPARIAGAAAGMWDGITDAFRGAVNWIIEKWNGLKLTIGGQHVGLPFGMGFDIPTITLNTPNIPTFHSGGEFRAPAPGGEGLALLRDREQVTTPETMGEVVALLAALLAEFRRGNDQAFRLARTGA